MSPFRRKRDGDDESSQDTVEAPAAPGADEPDPAAWALPADAGAVTTDAGTAATDAAAADAVDEETEPDPEPVAVEPEPVVAAPVDPAPPPAPEARSAWTPPPAAPADKLSEVSEQRPELLVAGAFAGAFVFARILKRITNG